MHSDPTAQTEPVGSTEPASSTGPASSTWPTTVSTSAPSLSTDSTALIGSTAPAAEITPAAEIVPPAPAGETLGSVTAPPSMPPEGSRHRDLRWLLRPIAIYLFSRIFVAIAFVVVALTTDRGLSGELYIWDSRWFIRAAEHGYPSHLPMTGGHVAGNTIAFFPIFPLTIRWLSALTGLTLLQSGAAISSITGLTAIVAMWMLVRHYAGSTVADRATLLLAVFPGTFVFSLVYSEGIAIACVGFGLLALLKRRWLLAGLFGMVATATTPIALAFVVACAYCAVREIGARREWRSVAAPVIAALGFAGYMVWLWAHTGKLDAWRLTERGGWKSYPSLSYPWHIVARVISDPIAPTRTGYLLFGGIVLAAIGCVVAIRQRLPVPVLLYGMAAAALAAVSDPVGLRPRFLMLSFPLILAIGARLRGRSYVWAVVISASLLLAFTITSVVSSAVFP